MGRRPSVALFQRGLHRLREVVNVPLHCLVTESVSTHTGQLGLRIQGLPLPGHHIKLTRHLSYVCGGVVAFISGTLSEEVNLEALGKFIATVAVGFDDRHAAGQKPSSAGTLRHELH